MTTQTPIKTPPCTCEPWQRGNEWHNHTTEYHTSSDGDLTIVKYCQCESCFETWRVEITIPKTELDKYPALVYSD